MKKLVILTDNFLPRKDGISRFLSEIIPRLTEHYKITVICPNQGQIKGFSGIRFVKIPFSSRTAGDFKFAQFRPRTILRELKQADIIFSQTIGPIGGLGLFLARLIRKKTVCFIHSVEWELFSKAVESNFVKKYAPGFTKRLVRYLYRGCKELIVPSERIADMLAWQGINTPKTIIHLGVDTNRFSKKDAHALREKLQIEQQDLVIGYHGRIAKEKDVSTLVRAFVKLRKTHEQLKLLIVGDGVQAIIRRLQKQPGLIHVPAKENVEEYLNAMNIYCLPSLTETTSLSTLEAMSSELPVVTTEVGFVRDYIKEGINGYFFKTGDSFDLARKITILIKDEGLRAIMGERARKDVVAKFNWDQTAEKLGNFFAANM